MTEKQRNYLITLYRRTDEIDNLLTDQDIANKYQIDNMTSREVSGAITMLQRRVPPTPIKINRDATPTHKQLTYLRALFKKINLHNNCLNQEELDQRIKDTYNHDMATIKQGELQDTINDLHNHLQGYWHEGRFEIRGGWNPQHTS